MHSKQHLVGECESVSVFVCVLTVAHRCSRACLQCDDNPAKYKGHNPLCIPMEYGWTRYDN